MVKLEELHSEDEDDVESVEGGKEEEVLLGFVDEPASPDALERHLFPSKVGGVPAWLDPVNLPRGEATACGFCGRPLEFLMQVYGPLETDPDAFHRMLFLFICKQNSCLRRHFKKQGEPDQKHSVRAFRCQVPRSNPFYSFHPAKLGTLPPAGPSAPLCDWCGAWTATKRCGGCRDHAYCSKEHQVEHWKGGHSTACKRLDKSAAPSEATSARGERVSGTSSDKETASKASASGSLQESGSRKGNEDERNHFESKAGELDQGVDVADQNNAYVKGHLPYENGSEGGAGSSGDAGGRPVEASQSEENRITEAENLEAQALSERMEKVSKDSERFPVSPVDWENGGKQEVESESSSSVLEPDSAHISEISHEDDTNVAGRNGKTDFESVSTSGQESESRKGEKDVIKNSSEKKAASHLKKQLPELTAVVKPRALNPRLWPELEIVVESEADYEVKEGSSSGSGDVSALLEQYGRRVEKKREFSEADLEEAEAGMRDLAGDKKQWAAFEARLMSAPEQVIRYCRSPDAKVLWPSCSQQPTAESIPACRLCGSGRIFEFQVLPQLLYYMGVDSSDPETLDWGTLAVYTCSRSCSGGKDAYKEEFVWVQIAQ